MSDRKSVAVLTRLTLESLEDRSLLSISSIPIVDIAADSGNDNLSVIESQSVSDSDANVSALIQEVDDLVLTDACGDEFLAGEDSVDELHCDAVFASFEKYIDESFELLDVSTGLVREVVFYSRSNASNVDLTDETKLFIERSPSVFSNGENLLLNSGGGEEGDIQVGTLAVSSGSTELLEADGYNSSGGSATSCFVLQVPEVPDGYKGFLRFAGVANIGTDYSINEGTSPSSTPTLYTPGLNGITQIDVSGGSSICVFPIADNAFEPTEIFSITFGLIQLSGGATFIGNSVSATITDTPNTSYKYVLRSITSQILTPWSSNRPEESNEDDEWGNADFIAFYYRSNPEPLGNSPNALNSVDLEDAGLLDDYRREMFNDSNLVLWNSFEHRFFSDISSDLLNGRRVVLPTNGNAYRDFTFAPDLFVYGHGTTLVNSVGTASLVARTETTDHLGVSSITELYSLNVQHYCSTQDKFEEPLDWHFEVFGERYWLTGEWTETATYNVMFEFDRVPVSE